MECCKASQFSNDAGARIWQAADVGYLALQYGAWLTWACLTLQLSSHLVPLLLQESSHLVPLLLQESSLHFLSFLLKLFGLLVPYIHPREGMEHPPGHCSAVYHISAVYPSEACYN